MRFLKRLFPWFVIAVAIAIAIYLPDASPERYTDLATMFSTERGRQGNAGYAVAVVRNGKAIYREAFGTDGTGKALGVDTAMYLGPASEVLSGALLYTLVLNKTLSLDDKVRSLLTWFPVAADVDFEKEGDTASVGATTLRDLASHSVYLRSRDFSSLASTASGMEAGELDPGVFRRLRANAGTATRSRLAYRIIGQAIEAAGRAPFDELLQDKLLIPLEMHSTTSRPDSLRGTAVGAGLFFGLYFPYDSRVPQVAAPADGIVSTAADMARFLAYISAPPQTKRLASLPPRSVAALYQPLQPGGGTGYGWRISNLDGDRRVFQGGSIEGFSSRVVLWPERGAGLVILSPQGGAIQSNIVLPMLAKAAEDIMFTGSAPRLFPVGRVLALLAVCSLVYLSSLALQTAAAFSWMRALKDRYDAFRSDTMLWLIVARSVLGILLRILAFFAIPVALGWLMGRTLGPHDFFLMDPGIASVVVAALILGSMRNVARLVWVFGSELGIRLAAGLPRILTARGRARSGR